MSKVVLKAVAAPKPAPPAKKAKPGPQPLVHIQDGHLLALVNDERFVREFPFMRSLRDAQTPRRSSCCAGAGNAYQARAAALRTAKKVIAGLPEAKKNTLRQMLNARRLRITYKREDGQAVELTF